MYLTRTVLLRNKVRNVNFCNILCVRRTLILDVFGSYESVLRIKSSLDLRYIWEKKYFFSDLKNTTTLYKRKNQQKHTANRKFK